MAVESCNMNTKSGWFSLVLVQNTATLRDGVARSRST